MRTSRLSNAARRRMQGVELTASGLKLVREVLNRHAKHDLVVDCFIKAIRKLGPVEGLFFMAQNWGKHFNGKGVWVEVENLYADMDKEHRKANKRAA
jgi:hypothetical protein